MTNLLTAKHEFLRHCRFEKNLSQKTLKSYDTDLRQLSEFLFKFKYSKEVDLITKTELRAYMESISVLKPKSIKRKVATIKAMFNFLEFEDIIAVNPFRKMKIKIREPKLLPKVMNIGEIQKIFITAYGRNKMIKESLSYPYFESLRNIAVIELLFGTGARVSEIANLKIESIDVNTGAITIIGKGNKERIIQICNKESLKTLNSYYNHSINKIAVSGGFFLINRFGGKLSDQSIRNIVKNLSKCAGVEQHITPHMFRHSVATLLLENEVDIKYIQSILGHSSIVTTQIYTHVNREKQRQILKAKHPRKTFSMNDI